MNWTVLCFHAALGKGARLYILPSMWDGEEQPPYRFNVGDRLALEFTDGRVSGGLVKAILPDGMEIVFGDDVTYTVQPTPPNAPAPPLNSKIPYDDWIVV